MVSKHIFYQLNFLKLTLQEMECLKTGNWLKTIENSCWLKAIEKGNQNTSGLLRNT